MACRIFYDEFNIFTPSFYTSNIHLGAVGAICVYGGSNKFMGNISAGGIDLNMESGMAELHVYAMELSTFCFWGSFTTTAFE